MPRHNRVTPFGQIVAAPARGHFMGNRGVLHDARGRIRRPFQLQRWIICRLAFKGRRRPIMQPGRYTELFFLDEATALAAGHRPCWECRRERYLAFREAWARANPDLVPNDGIRAHQIDVVLHAERLDEKREKRVFTADIGSLPDGTFVALAGQPYLVKGPLLMRWTLSGYDAFKRRPAEAAVQVLTPRSIVSALAQAYRPRLHDSAG